MQGVSRSAAVIIDFVMYHLKINLEAATTLVRQSRLCVEPNSGFQRQLKEMESDLLARNSAETAEV